MLRSVKGHTTVEKIKIEYILKKLTKHLFSKLKNRQLLIKMANPLEQNGY